MNDFPELKELMEKVGMKFFLQKFLNYKPGYSEEYSLERIEDLFYGFKHMLSFLVEDLVSKGKLNEAKGLVMRHNIYHRLREETKEKI
jgi:hypothetical protein